MPKQSGFDRLLSALMGNTRVGDALTGEGEFEQKQNGKPKQTGKTAADFDRTQRGVRNALDIAKRARNFKKGRRR